MSEAIDRVRAFVDACEAFVDACEAGTPEQSMCINNPDAFVADLRELLAGYIPPEHHAAIREALGALATGLMQWTDDVETAAKYEATRAALAAMPKAGA